MSGLEDNWQLLSKEQKVWLEKLSVGDTAFLPAIEATKLKGMRLAETSAPGGIVITDLGRRVLEHGTNQA
ncbi:MAG: hypothetical protein ABJJ37_05680 [Roseibium sp.]